MESRSDLISATRSDRRRALHLLSLLCPARPPELVARCSLFPAWSELVLHLCSFPDSPISLTADLLVVPSPAAVRALLESSAASDFFRSVSNQLRKPKRVVLDCGLEFPRKRRLILSSEDDNEENHAQLEVLQCTSPEVRFDFGGYAERSVNRTQLDILSLLNRFFVGRINLGLTNIRLLEAETCTSIQRIVDEETMTRGDDCESALPLLPVEAFDDFTHLFCFDGTEERPVSTMEAGNVELNDLAKVVEMENSVAASEDPMAQKRSSKLGSEGKKYSHVNSTPQSTKQPCESLEDGKAVERKEKSRSRGDCKGFGKRGNVGKSASDSHVRGSKRDCTYLPPKDQMEQKLLPVFESYVVEEEEGSGGYGTVYRAKRKNDGATVAIKCPHAKAHKHHVHNEQRMLERFGGKNFVIKYEGCIKSGDSDCFVLEHVKHDRPEVLKKEIDVFQLQWYGYCMFRALASLHKQGIVHRDVKPGNFLFSRKTGKGFLIDFNLALDLHQKLGNRNDGKSRKHGEVRLNNVKLPNEKPVLTKDQKLPNAPPKTTEGYKSKMDMKNLRRKALAQTKTHNNDLGSLSVNKSQGADGSGITSAERMREPLPCRGRKELLSLVQEARMHQNPGASSSITSPMRKRVVAPSQIIDNNNNNNNNNMLVYFTPMPCVGGSHMMSRGRGKSKREGPCVGTKGFRAPEVLFRSLFQGPKVDVWSAGVTLLYLMIGRTPFFGDPEQNIKDIAKLRGSEDLWEVAKLHNRESSFPKDLYKSESLTSTKLWDWCESNTKRPDFLKEMPTSLFDLVEKCLTANPRQRITAEEALRHKFFSPCHEGLRKQRLDRQALNQGCENGSTPLHGRSILKPSRV